MSTVLKKSLIVKKKSFIIQNIKDEKTLNVPMTQIFVSKIDNPDLDFISTTGLCGCLTLIISSSTTFLFTHVQSDLIKTTMSKLEKIKKVHLLFIQLMNAFNSKSDIKYDDINSFFMDKNLEITLVTASFNDLLFKMTYNYLMPKMITFTQIETSSIVYNFKKIEGIEIFFKLSLEIYRNTKLEEFKNISEYIEISEDVSSITNEEALEIIENINTLPKEVLKEVPDSIIPKIGQIRNLKNKTKKPKKKKIKKTKKKENIKNKTKKPKKKKIKKTNI